MTVHPLTNERWGFSSKCFVCEPSNQAGLRIPFEHDDEAGVVRATFTLDDRFSGAPAYVHGGVTLSVLDEAMSWATIALAERFAVTTETTTRFGHAVKVGRTYTVEARVESHEGDAIATSAVVLDDRRRPCVEATATFTVFGPAQAVDVLGVEATGDDARFLGP